MAPHSQPEKGDTPEKPEKGDAPENPIEVSSDDEPEPKPPPPPGSMEAFVLEAGRMGVPPGGARERLGVTLRKSHRQLVRVPQVPHLLEVHALHVRADPEARQPKPPTRLVRPLVLLIAAEDVDDAAQVRAVQHRVAVYNTQLLEAAPVHRPTVGRRHTPLI